MVIHFSLIEEVINKYEDDVPVVQIHAHSKATQLQSYPYAQQ